MGLFSNLRNAGNVLRHVRGPGALVQLVRHPPPKILNSSGAPGGDVSPERVAAKLRDLRSSLKASVLSPTGDINYVALKEERALQELRSTTPLLKSVGADTLPTEDEKKAFFINVYNVLCLDGVLALDIKKSVMELPLFFSSIAYQIGDSCFTPDEIENGILRGNRAHPFTKKALFSPGDPRLSYCVSKLDPRIHAALVCASKSCPAVRFYEASALETQLENATLLYVNGSTTVDSSRKEVWLPMTYDYYSADFGGAKGTLAFVQRYAEGALKTAVQTAIAEDYRVRFSRYDWSLNQVT